MTWLLCVGGNSRRVWPGQWECSTRPRPVKVRIADIPFRFCDVYREVLLQPPARYDKRSMVIDCYRRLSKASNNRQNRIMKRIALVTEGAGIGKAICARLCAMDLASPCSISTWKPDGNRGELQASATSVHSRGRGG